MVPGFFARLKVLVLRRDVIRLREVCQLGVRCGWLLVISNIDEYECFVGNCYGLSVLSVFA